MDEFESEEKVLLQRLCNVQIDKEEEDGVLGR